MKTFGHPRVVATLTPTFGIEPPFAMTYKRKTSIHKIDITYRMVFDEPKTRYERDEVV